MKKNIINHTDQNTELEKKEVTSYRKFVETHPTYYRNRYNQLHEDTTFRNKQRQYLAKYLSKPENRKKLADKMSDNIENLSDWYVRTSLRYKFVEKNIKTKDIPDDIIILQRNILKLKRELNNITDSNKYSKVKAQIKNLSIEIKNRIASL